MSLRGALDVRVSTDQQAPAQTIEQPLGRLRTRAAAQGWDTAQTPGYRDEGQSGATRNRPGLDRLRDAVRRGELDHILITGPDRRARNHVHQMIPLDEFARAGCQLEFLDRPPGDAPHDRLVLPIRGAVAEYARTLIADRMRRGRQTEYRAGVLLPWTKRPYGYRFALERPRDPAGVRLDEAAAAAVREIYARYAGEGGSRGALAKDLQRRGLPTPSGKRL